MYFHSLYIIIFCLIAAIQGFSHEKHLEICERYYEEGQYDKALEQSQRLINKLQKGDYGFVVAKVMLYQAKYYEALGRYSDFESVLLQALKVFQTKGNESISFGVANLMAAYLYTIYSDINTAEVYLKNSEEILSNFKNEIDEDHSINFTKLYVKAQILLERGDYKGFWAISDVLKNAAQKQITSSETVFEIYNDKFVTKKLTPAQLRRRKRQYAHVLTLIARSYRLYGDYQAAEMKLNEAENWIKSNLNNKDMAFVRNQTERIQLRIDRLEPASEIKKDLQTNIFLAERRFGLSHKDFFELHQVLIDFMMKANYTNTTNFQLWEMRTNASKFYGKDKLPYAVWGRQNAQRLMLQGNYRAARQDLEELLADFRKVPSNHIERIKILDLMYQLLIKADDYEAAYKFLKKKQEAIRTVLGENSLLYFFAKVDESVYYLNFTNNFQASDSLYREYFESKVSTAIAKTHKDYVKYLFHRSEYFEILDQYSRARECLEEGLDILKQRFPENSIPYAAGLERLIDLELTQGDYRAANEHIEKVLSIFNAQYDGHTHQYEYSKALETSARYFALLGLFDDAKQNLSRSSKLYKRSETSIAASKSADELAYLYIRSEKFNQAENILLKAIDIRKQRYGQENRFLITSYNQLARLRYIFGEYLEAERLANEAYHLAKKIFGDSSVKVTESLILRSELYMAMGNYQTAEESISEAIRIQELLYGKNHIQLVNSLTQLALIKFYNNEPIEKIESLLLQVLAIIRENLGEDNPMYANALKNLALVYTEGTKYEEALASLRQANQIWISKFKTEKNTNSAEIELLIGDVEMRRNQLQDAVDQYNKSRKTYRKVFNKQHPMYVKAISKAGRAYYAQRRYSRALTFTNRALKSYLNYIEKFFPALSEREKTRYWNLIRNDFEFYNSLAIRARNPFRERLPGKMYNNVLATKGILLSSSIKTRNKILNSGDSSLIALYNTWIEKKELLTQVIAMNAEQLREEGIDIKKIEKEIEAIEKQLSQTSAEFGTSKEKLVTWKDVRKNLKEDEVAIEIVRYRHFERTFTDSIIYLALQVSPRSYKAPKVIIFSNGKEMEERMLKYYKSSIKYNIEDELSYKSYWKPIDLQLPPNCKKVYFSPEGAYTQINLESIVDDTGTYLIDRLNIALIGSTKDIAVRHEKEMMKYRREIVLFGNPAFYKDMTDKDILVDLKRNIPQLPGTYYEVRGIDSMLITRTTYIVNTYTGTYATEEELVQIESPKVFHIATHGFFMPDEEESNTENALNANRTFNNPLLRCGVLLRNAGEMMKDKNIFSYNKEPGILTAYEAMNLNLDYTELVVLSACETGRGDVKVGEGVYGLQRAFLVAGANALVMSLFKVNDEATQRLMLYFYQNWIERKMDKREAFILAKKQLRKKYPEPIFWAPFIMIGAV
ncbi:MAG: CHAT domain-containing protein [Cytophagales bacterium]|nr:CHAT domain-containing protein [Cytophagales bacterium]MDW8384562.1 CHAT domain-containing protein [Flammeovirgaceae bacterium]